MINDLSRRSDLPKVARTSIPSTAVANAFLACASENSILTIWPSIWREAREVGRSCYTWIKEMRRRVVSV